MNDNKQNLQQSVSDIETFLSTQRIVYGLFALSFFVAPASIAGLIVAYLVRSEAAPWLQSHYTYLIRTFWIGMLYVFISALAVMIFIGPLLMFGVAVWFLARIVLGWMKMEKGEPIANPQSWWMGLPAKS